MFFNLIHASDSPEGAEKEIHLKFLKNKIYETCSKKL